MTRRLPDATSCYADYERSVDGDFGVWGRHTYFQELKARVVARVLRDSDPSAARGVVADVGCGTGTLLGLLPSFRVRVGIEPDPAMVAQASAKERDFLLVQAGDVLPLKDGCADAAVLSCVLHHTAPSGRRRLLGEVHRVLRPGGRLFIFEHNPLNLPVLLFLKMFVRVDRGARFLTRQAATTVAVESGFERVRSAFCSFFPYPFRWFARFEPQLGWLPCGGQYWVLFRKRESSGDGGAFSPETVPSPAQGSRASAEARFGRPRAGASEEPL